MAVDDGSISIEVVPDGDGFQLKLNKVLAKVAGSVEVKPNLSGFATETKQALKKVNLSTDVKLTPTFTKNSVQKAISQLKGSAGAIDIKINPTFTKNSVQTLKADLKRQFNTVTKKGETIDAPIKIKLELDKPSSASIAKVKKQILADFGVLKLPATAIAGKATLSQITSPISKNAINDFDRTGISSRNLARDLSLLGRAATSAKPSLFSALGSISVGQVAFTAFSTGIISATKNFIKFGLESSKEVQNVRRAFQGFIGDTQKVNKLFGDLQDFAAVTPFDLESLLKSSRTLLGSGFAANDLLSTLKDISGVGAQLGASGVAIDRVTTALAKIKGQGKVTQRELRTIFTAFPGFSPIKVLATEIDRFGGNTGKALKAITASSVTADEAVNALLAGMAKFPGAANALYQQSLNLSGSQETLRDRFQQVARAAQDPALNNLAANYRKAAETFKKQSFQADSTNGITGLVNSFAGAIPDLAKLVVPGINSFAKAFTPIVDTFAEFVADGGGEALLEVFKAGVQILPAFNAGLSLTLSIVKPFLPVIEGLAKGIGAVPPQLIAVAGGLKLLGGGIGTGGILGKILGNKAELAGSEKKIGDISNGINKVKVSAVGAGNSLKAFLPSLALKGYTEELDKLRYKQTLINQSMLNGSIGAKAFASETKNIGSAISSLQGKGANIGSAFSGAKNSIKSFASTAVSSVKSFGIELGIAALVGGISYFANKAAESKKIMSNIARDAELIGEKLRFDTSAQTGAIAEVNLLETVIRDTEEGAKAFKRLDEGYKKTQISAKTSLAFLKDFQKANGEFDTTQTIDQQGGGGGGSAQVKFSKTLNENITRIDQARKLVEGDDSLIKKVITGSDKEFKKVQSDLALAGKIARDARIGDFGAVNAENTAKNLDKLRKQYKESYLEILDDNIKISKDAGDKSGAAFLQGVKKEFEKTGDVAGAYEKSAKQIAKNAVVFKGLEDEFRKIANGSIKGAEAQDIFNRATEAGIAPTTEAAEALAGLGDAVSNINTGIGEFSFDSIKNSLDPAIFKGFYDQVVSSLETDPSKTGALIDRISASLGLDADGAKEFAKKIGAFKSELVDEIRKTGEDIKAALPAITDAFKVDFKFEIGGISAETLKANLKAYSDGIASFGANINKLKAEFPDLAQKIASLGPAAGGQLAKDLANNPALAQQIRESLAGAESVYGQYGKDVIGIVQTNFEKINGFNPGELGGPSFDFTAPDQTEIDAIAQKILSVEEAIKARKEAIKKSAVPLRGRFGVEDAASLSENDTTLNRLEEKLNTLKVKQTEINTTIFTNLTSQATTTATVINSTFAQADISGAIKPQIDAVTADLAKVPEQIKTAFTGDFSAQNLLAATGSSIGMGLVNGINVGLTTGVELFRQIWISSFESLGSQIGQGFTLGFQNGLVGIKDAILGPFRATVAPLNKYFIALASAGKAIGLNVAFTPIPQFHDGGFPGDPKAQKHNGVFKQDEYLAVLKKGESVLNPTATKNVGKQTINALNKGKIGDGLGVKGEEASSYSTAADRQVIASAKANYFENALVGPSQNILQKMADAIVTKFADASLKYLDNIDSKISSNVGDVPGVITSGSVVEQLLAAKGKPGSFKTLIKIMKGSGLPFGVSSTVRPGSITASGNLSLHSAARAVDFIGTAKEMLNMSKWWTQYAPYLAELIHTPMGFGIKNGKKMQYPANVLKGHYNHGHVALFDGGMVRGSAEGTIATIGERGQSELVLPLGQPDRMAQIINYAIRSGEMSHQGQKAVAQVLPGNTTNRTSRTENKIEVTVVAPVEDAHLQGTIIANRVLAALKGL